MVLRYCINELAQVTDEEFTLVHRMDTTSMKPCSAPRVYRPSLPTP